MKKNQSTRYYDTNYKITTTLTFFEVNYVFQETVYRRWTKELLFFRKYYLKPENLSMQKYKGI